MKDYYQKVLKITFTTIFILAIYWLILKMFSLYGFIDSQYEKGEYVYSMTLLKFLIYLSIPILSFILSKYILSKESSFKFKELFFITIIINLLIFLVNFINPSMIIFPLGLKNDLYFLIKNLLNIKSTAKITMLILEIVSLVSVILLVLLPIYIRGIFNKKYVKRT